MLSSALWPEVKGDASTERELQRQRRATSPEARYHSPQDVPATPFEPAEHDQLPQRDMRLTPTIPLEPVAQPEPGPSDAQQQMMGMPNEMHGMMHGMGAPMMNGNMNMLNGNNMMNGNTMMGANGGMPGPAAAPACPNWPPPI